MNTSPKENETKSTPTNHETSDNRGEGDFSYHPERYQRLLKRGAKEKDRIAKKNGAHDEKTGHLLNLSGELELDLFSKVVKPKGIGDYNRVFDFAKENPVIEEWLRSESPSKDYPVLTELFNHVNLLRNEEGTKAVGTAFTVLKGTSFDEQRINCVNFTTELMAGEVSGEVLLVPEPENMFDENAVAVKCKETGKMLGYIPRKGSVNIAFAQAIKANRFCGAHVIKAILTTFTKKENAVLVIVTGWI